MANDRNDPGIDDPSWVDNILARAKARARETTADAPAEPAGGLFARAEPEVAERPNPRPAARRERPLASPPPPRREQLLADAPDPAERATPPTADAPDPAERATTPASDTPERAAPSVSDTLAARFASARETQGAPRERAAEEPAPEEPADPRAGRDETDDHLVAGDSDAADDGGDGDVDGEDDERSGWRNSLEWLAVAGGAVLVALLIRAFVIQAFYIPSPSMEPTLHEKDRIVVNKLSYRLHEVHRGDLIVFRRPPAMPPSEAHDLIKRVIALPGETIELRGNDIYIDDRKLTEPYLPEGTITTNLGWIQGCANPSSERGRCTLPPGHLFVMGDNRQRSSDGRFFGPISEDLIVGRAFLRVWPLGKIDFL